MSDEHTQHPDAAKSIEDVARGGNGRWQFTAVHPEHGEITFTAGLPVARDLLAHSVAIDELLAELSPGVEPRRQTQILAAALAALTPADPDRPMHGRLVQLPVVGERRVADEERGSEVVHRVFYDAPGETDTAFLISMWVDYSLWRNALLSDEQVTDLGKDSEPTPGSGSNGDSDGPGDAPPTTRA